MQTALDVGIDVASQAVVVACAAGSFAPRTLRNEARELRAWLGSLPAGSRVGMEATGRYHQRVADLAHASGLTVYVLNPRDLRSTQRGWAGAARPIGWMRKSLPGSLPVSTIGCMGMCRRARRSGIWSNC